MTCLSVWAPKPNEVELCLGDDRIPMQKAEDGWWSAEVESAPGMDYAFSLDGSPPLPDPRSPWQPHGVHGPSRRVDHAAFHWTDQKWQAKPLPAALIYELHIGTFTPAGTFESAIERLDYLANLGVTHVELMPVNQFSGNRGWGYDGVDLFAPHHAYGGPEGLKRLVNACHEKGLAAILDVVYNHLGPEGNYLSQYGPYFTEHHFTNWGPAVNLDEAGSDEVRRFLIDNALMWLRDYHFDGLRIDAVHALVDDSAVHFLEELAAAVDLLEAGLGRHLTLIAESDLNDPRLVKSLDVGGYGLDAAWSDDFHHALHALLTGEQSGYYADFGQMDQLAKALSQVYVYDGCYSPFRGRRHGRPVAYVPGHCFLGYLQNHDQIGNRAAGERISHLVSPGRAKIGAALMLTAPFVPMLFQGEEWGASSPFLYFADHQDPELCKAVSEGRRNEFAAFGWNPQDVPDPVAEETFLRSRLKWDERGQEPHASLAEWYQALIRFRREELVLTDGRLDRVHIRCDPAAGWLCMERTPVYVICNLGENAVSVPLKGSAGMQVVLASDPAIQTAEDAVILPKESVVIMKET